MWDFQASSLVWRFFQPSPAHQAVASRVRSTAASTSARPWTAKVPITSEVAGLTVSKVSTCLACPCAHTVPIVLASLCSRRRCCEASKSPAAGCRETPSADPCGPGGGHWVPFGEACAADRPGADGPDRNLVTERPYVLLSSAMSVDGCLDAPGGERLVLSGAADLDRVDGER